MKRIEEYYDKKKILRDQTKNSYTKLDKKAMEALSLITRADLEAMGLTSRQAASEILQRDKLKAGHDALKTISEDLA